MGPLAKLWTWTGHLFIPLALGWAYYVRNGPAGTSLPEGVLVSRAYAGLLATLAAGSVLAWTAGLYVFAARKNSARVLIPPNTTFEETQRSLVISWGTATVFSIAVILGVIVFSTSYSHSQIHGWDSTSPLQTGFWASRVQAHRDPCPGQPCFALGQRVNPPNRPFNGVFEYIPFATDGAVVLLALTLVSGLGMLAFAVVKTLKERREEALHLR